MKDTEARNGLIEISDIKNAFTNIYEGITTDIVKASKSSDIDLLKYAEREWDIVCMVQRIIEIATRSNLNLDHENEHSPPF